MEYTMFEPFQTDLSLDDALDALVAKYESLAGGCSTQDASECRADSVRSSKHGVDMARLRADLSYECDDSTASVHSFASGYYFHNAALYALQYLDSWETKNYLLAYMREHRRFEWSQPLLALESFVSLATVAEMYACEELIYSWSSWLAFSKKEILLRLCGYRNESSTLMPDGRHDLYSPDELICRKLENEEAFRDAEDWLKALSAGFFHSGFRLEQTTALLERWITGTDKDRKFFAIRLVGWRIGLEKYIPELLKGSEATILQLLKARPYLSKNERWRLRKFLDHENADIQYWAAVNIGPRDEKLRVLLREAARDLDDDLKRAAREVLGAKEIVVNVEPGY